MHAHLWRSLNHALVLTIAALLTTVAWYSIRLPDASLLIVNAAMLGANVAYDIERDAERTALLFFYFLSAGVLQFALALLWKFPFFQAVAGAGISYGILRFLPHRAAGCAALIVGNLALRVNGGFYEGIQSFFDLSFSFAGAGIACFLGKSVHQSGSYTPAFPGGFSPRYALKITAILFIGVLLFQVSNHSGAIWIPLTAGFLYNQLFRGGDALTIGTKRVISTIIAMIAAFLYMSCFSYYDYRFIYYLPLWGGLAFFLYYYTGNYYLYSILYLMSFTLYADFKTTTGAELNLPQLAAGRILFSAIGILLVCFFEWAFPLQENP